jgi:hypothetical protein
MEQHLLYEDFKRLSWQKQLGNLASTLATISTQSKIPLQDELTSNLLREVALMIEWCAIQVPSEFHWELAAMQREYLNWHRVFPVEDVRSILAMNTRHYSDRVLDMAGLLETEEALSIVNS